MDRVLHRRKPKARPLTIGGVLHVAALTYVVAVASYVVLSWGWNNPELMLATERGYFITDDGRVFTVRLASD